MLTADKCSLKSMGWQRPNYRTVIYTENFEQDLARLCPDEPSQKLFDDRIMQAVSWALARAAEAFPEIPNTSLRVIKADGTPQLPMVRIYYTIDNDDECSLWAMDEVDIYGPEEDATS